MTVLQNVMEAPCRVKRESKGEVRDRAAALLDRVGLGEKKDSYYAALWKMIFPNTSAVEKNGALPWGVPSEHAGDPHGDTGFERVEPESLPELQPVYATVDGRHARSRTLTGIAGDHTDSLLADPVLFSTRVAAGPEAQRNPALAQLFNLNPQFQPALNDGNVTNASGDPDTLLNGWQVQVGERWTTA